MHRRDFAAATAQNAETPFAVRKDMPHMPASAFTEVANYAKNHDMSQLGARRKRFAEYKDTTLPDTPCGPVIVRKAIFCQPPHAHRDLVFVSQVAYVHTAFNAGGGSNTMLANAMRSLPYRIGDESKNPLVAFFDKR